MELQAAVEALDKLRPVLPPQAAYAVSDHARFVFYRSGELIDLGIRPGDPLREGMLTWRAVRERRALAQMMVNNPFRVPYFAASVPITDGDEVKGCVTAIYHPAAGSSLQLDQVSNIVPTAKRPFLIGKAHLAAGSVHPLSPGVYRERRGH